MPPSDRLDPILHLRDQQECTALHLAVLRGEPMHACDGDTTRPHGSRHGLPSLLVCLSCTCSWRFCG
jgi:hypothetical protein